MKGYKVFNSDWTCKNFQYEVGKTFTEDVVPKCCDRGFHFCTKIIDCFNYYSFNPSNKVAEVEALGDVDTSDRDSKCSTNKIRIVREITWHEVLDLVNTGKECTGHHNSGDDNSGCYNSGKYNTGHHNSGDYNTGHHNSGNCNSGNCNTGHYNSGDWNSGHYNSGDYNGGDWNKTNFSSGCFNTELSTIFLFNKPSDWTYLDWLTSNARHILTDCPSNDVSWIWESRMTNEEKERNPEYIITGGFLRQEKADDRQAWWNSLDEIKKSYIYDIPNFDADIFREITGIDVNAN